MNGKGSLPRPYSVPLTTYEKNWMLAFERRPRPRAKTTMTPEQVKLGRELLKKGKQ